MILNLFSFDAGDKSPIDWYDCKGRTNGNYPHPVDCTRFVTCSNEIASERDCAICEYHPIRCPEGRLIFDSETNMCLFANEAKCQSLCDQSGDTVRRRRGGKIFQ